MRGGDKCHSRYPRTTIIQFKCNNTAGNYGKGTPIFNREEHCIYFFDWETKYACLDHPIDQVCRADYKGHRYDLSPLVRTSGKNWQVLDGGTEGKRLRLFYINICSDILPAGSAKMCKSDSSVCLIDEIGPHSLGRYRTSPTFDPSTNTVQLTYTDGDVCSQNKRKQSIITLICNPGDLDSSPIFLRQSPDECIFEFEWHTAAACVLAKKWGTNCQIMDEELGVNFDLNRLKTATSYYNITYGNFDYNINVCGEIKGSKCDSNGRNTPQPGVCQIKHGGSPSEAYNAGQVNTNVTYFDGIIKLTYKNGDAVENSKPSVSRETQIAFECDRKAGIGSPSFIPNNITGVLEFEWKTEYACPNIPVECSVTANGKQYDLSSLSRKASQGSWTIVDDANPQRKVKYYLNVCRSLNEVKVGKGCSPFAAICRTHYSADQEQLSDIDANLGEVTSGPTVQTEGHLMLQYHTVKPYCNDNGAMKNFTTTINFVCKKGDLTSGPARPLKIGTCAYSFLWETEAACPIEQTETSSVNCEIKDRNSDYTFNLSPLRKNGDTDYYDVDGPNSRKFRLNICGGISSSNCDQIESANSSMCESLKNGSKPAITKYGHEELKYSDDGRVSLTYYGSYDSQGNKNEVVILFLCRQNVQFGVPKFRRLIEHTYNFDFETSLVCRPQPVDCVVEDQKGTMYDLSPLAKAPINWDVLDTRQGHTDLKYYINVCRPINLIAGSTCPGGPVGGCQVSTKGSAYNLGYIQSKPVVSGIGALTLVYTNGDLCHKGKPTQAHRSTRINFFCSKEEHSPTFEEETPTCEYIFNWQTPAACPIQRITGNNCQVTDPIYNYRFDLSSLRKATADYKVPFGEYVYQINVCGPLVNGISDCKGTGACQTKPLDTNFNFNAGKSTSTLVYDAGEITLTYDSGKPCHQNKFNRSTIITFLCDQSKSGKDGPTYINETSDCTYQFEWPTKLACPPFKVEDCSVTNSKGEQFDLTSLASTTNNLEYIDSLAKKKYIFNVCRSLVHKKKQTCPFNAAACIIDLNDHNATTRYHNIGEVNDHQVVYESRLQLHYVNGEPCNGGKEKTSTRIILECDKTAIDTRPSGHFMVGQCEHHFVWASRAACPLGSEGTDTHNSGNCTAQNPATGYTFDLSSLTIKSPWYKLDDREGHSYTLNVCGKVTGTDCTGSDNLAVCQVENQGEKRKFKGGNANSQLHYNDGILFLNYAGGDKCHQGKFERSSIINFICSESAGRGHPEYIAEEDDCTYQFYWYTNLACEEKVKCSIDVNDTYSIDLSPLIKQSGHHMAITTSTSASGVPRGSTFYINVCRPLNPVYGSLCPPGSSACMTVPGQKPQGLGKIHSPPSVDTSGRITLVYDNGSPCKSQSSKNVSTKIIFNCKKGLSQGTPVLEQVTDDCQYVFQWDTSIVCRDDDTSTAGADCVYTDKATHAVYNLTELRARSSGAHTITRNGLQYIVNVCGSTGYGNKGCEASSICRVNGSTGFGYGKTSNSVFVKTEETLKLIYTDDHGCNGKKSQGIISFRCEKDIYPGEPKALFVGPCETVFEWKTRAVCPSVADQCVMSYNGHEYDLRILSNQMSSWQLKDSSGNSYWINICQGIHNSPNSDKCYPMSSSCIKTNSGEITSLGLITTQTMHMDSDGKTLLVEYTNGSVCSGNNKPARTVIKFICGKTIGGPVFVSRSVCHIKRHGQKKYTQYCKNGYFCWENILRQGYFRVGIFLLQSIHSPITPHKNILVNRIECLFLSVFLLHNHGNTQMIL
ncbi:hypothetical protein FSP39_013248 [Pinctada imbricata]|uniref:MRH domain-containing protein n=1 Tax=Pinctada imbricata TaxID=66713 RepID=A0AA89C0R8_PINIB|nr:hypothetical protein FSP39_013248 [Pinctada imbricata]